MPDITGPRAARPRGRQHDVPPAARAGAGCGLSGGRGEERGSVQGGVKFDSSNRVGAYLSLSGIGLIYGRTGALNMAQIGAYIDRHPPGGLVVVAFLLIISGLLIKSA